MVDDLWRQKPIPDDVVLESDVYWMRLALAQAGQAAALGEVPVGAVAVLNGAIIGAGFNRKEIDRDPLAHAEIVALRAAAAAVQNWRLIGVTLYCTLEPCPMCAGAMIQARLPRLVYGARDTRFGADGSVVDVLRAPEFNHRVAITTGVLEEEAAALLQQFFQGLREKRGRV
ncbi:MAG: tRNA adenosine(34) deaminase TadA [Chloroflexi bacterium]|nr:tRNA adenosine(34) deaminase TadA [Chloroflexota bacterium]